jgi:hypothetical protein
LKLNFEIIEVVENVGEKRKREKNVFREKNIGNATKFIKYRKGIEKDE